MFQYKDIVVMSKFNVIPFRDAMVANRYTLNPISVFSITISITLQYSISTGLAELILRSFIKLA